MRSMVVIATAALALLAGSCGLTDGADDGKVTAVATTTILGDVASRVVECGGGEAASLMPVGADPHDYAPSSTDVRDMVKADLVIANGLGLEEGLASALEAAAEDGADVLEVAPIVDPIPLAAEEGDEHGGVDTGSLDPHVWLDAARMATAAERIGAELADLTGDAAFTACGKRAGEDLRELDAEVRDILSVVPEDRRVLVTDHRAFGYFAQAYDFRVAGVVVPGGSTLAEPSSEHLADLVEVLETTGVPAIFGDVAQNSALLDTLAQETGREIGIVELYVGSLGPEGSGVEDYAAMMVRNAELVADALTGSAESGP